MKKFTKIIVFLFILIAMFQQSLSQESGWAGDGLIKFQKFPTDSIIKYGLSADGDTLKTFHKDFKLYYWDIKSGTLIKEKQLPAGFITSNDFLTYYKLKEENVLSFIKSDLELYNLETDSLLYNSKILNHSNSYGMNAYIAYHDYDLKRNRFYFVLSIYYNWARTTSRYNLTYLYQLNQDTAIQVDPKLGFGTEVVLNRDYSKFLFTNFSNSYQSHFKTKYENAMFGLINKDNNFVTTISSSSLLYPPLIKYAYIRFLNDESYCSAFNSSTLYIWKLNPVKITEEHNPIKGYDSYSDYLYMRDDNFLAYSNYKIHIYDMNSKRVIDSSVVIDSNSDTYLKYSYKNDILCFFNKDKFGIADFKMLNTSFDLQISVDSTHAYAGNPYNVYLYGLPDCADVNWETSDGQTSNERNPIFTFENEGLKSFTVTVTYNNQTFKKTFENVVIVLPMLVADFESNTKVGDSPLKVKFSNKSMGNILTYTWNFVNGEEKFVSNEINPVITFRKTGYVSVELIIKDTLFTIKKIKNYYVAVNKTIIQDLDILQTFNLTSSKFTYEDYYNEIIEAFTLTNPLGTFVLNDTIFHLKVDRQYGPLNEYLVLSNIDINGIHTYKSGINNQVLLHTNPSELNYLYDDIVGVFGGNTLFIFRTSFEQLSPFEKYNWVGNSSEWYGNSPKNYLAFLKDSSVMVGANYNEGGSSIVSYGNDYRIKFSNDYTGKICGITFNSKNNHYYYLIKDSNSLDLKVIKYKLYEYDLNYSLLSSHSIDLSDNIYVNSISYIGNGDIVFCGFDKIDSSGLVGCINNSGEVSWLNSFSNWLEFSKIVVKKNSFLLTGLSKLAAGFIEVSTDGKKYNEFAFDTYKNLKNNIDLDIYNDSTLIVTTFINRFNGKITSNSYLVLSKVKYSPLFTESNPNDHPKTDSTTNRIKSINPNPALSEITIEFFKKLVPLEIQIYNSEGLLVDRNFLYRQKTSEASHNIQNLSIGVYFVKVITETEILEGKFIKY